MRATAGEGAEALVYLCCVMRRSSLYANLEQGGPYSLAAANGTLIPLDRVEQFAELITLDFANRVEQLRLYAAGSTELEAQRRIYTRAIPLLPRGAVAELGSFPRRRPADVFARRPVRAFRRSVWLSCQRCSGGEALYQQPAGVEDVGEIATVSVPHAEGDKVGVSGCGCDHLAFDGSPRA